MSKTLGEIFQNLSHGPLAGLAIGSEGSGTILSGQENRVTGLINQTLDTLYGRFLIYTRETVLRTIADKSLYALRKEHADTDSSTETKWIEDTAANPFTSDIVRILEIKNDDGETVKLNDVNDDTSIFTPSYDLLQTPEEVPDLRFYLLYQAKHARLDYTDPGQLVYLPAPLFGALEAYVAFLMFSSMNGQEHSQKAQEHLMKYETICRMVKDQNITNDSFVSTNSKLDDRGFV